MFLTFGTLGALLMAYRSGLIQATENFKVDFRADNLLDEQYTNPLNETTTSPLYEPGITLKLAATMRLGG